MSGIKSRPIYLGLTPDTHARANLAVCDAGGAEAVIELFARADDAFARRTSVVLSAEGASADQAAALQKRLSPANVETAPDLSAAIALLKAKLVSASMGLRLYAAGTESLIGSVEKTGIENFVDPLSIRTEHRGSLARRVQCVHCKGMTENVTTNIVKCDHCGLNLLVRDHYSKRQAAFQGVCVDAEVPGDVPVVDEVFK